MFSEWPLSLAVRRGAAAAARAEETRRVRPPPGRAMKPPPRPAAEAAGRAAEEASVQASRAGSAVVFTGRVVPEESLRQRAAGAPSGHLQLRSCLGLEDVGQGQHLQRGRLVQPRRARAREPRAALPPHRDEKPIDPRLLDAAVARRGSLRRQAARDRFGLSQPAQEDQQPLQGNGDRHPHRGRAPKKVREFAETLDGGGMGIGLYPRSSSCTSTCARRRATAGSTTRRRTRTRPRSARRAAGSARSSRAKLSLSRTGFLRSGARVPIAAPLSPLGGERSGSPSALKHPLARLGPDPVRQALIRASGTRSEGEPTPLAPRHLRSRRLSRPLRSGSGPIRSDPVQIRSRSDLVPAQPSLASLGSERPAIRLSERHRRSERRWGRSERSGFPFGPSSRGAMRPVPNRIRAQSRQGMFEGQRGTHSSRPPSERGEPESGGRARVPIRRSQPVGPRFLAKRGGVL